MPRDRRANIGTGIWSETSMRRLTRRQRDAYLLAYTQPDVSRCGVLPYRLRYLAGLAADTTIDDLTTDYRDLTATRHVIVDPADELMLIRTYVKHDGLLTQPLVVASMIRDYHAITSPTIRTAFLAEMRRLWEDADLEPRAHDGLALVLGATPADLGIKNADKVATAIGAGLLGPLIEAIRNGRVEPFPPKGLPKGLTEGQLEGLTTGQPEGQPDPRYNARATAPVTAPATAPVTASQPPATLPPPPDDPTGALLAAHNNACGGKLPPSSLAPVKTAIARLVAERTDPTLIAAGLERMRAAGKGPALLPQFVGEAAGITTNGRRSTTDDRVAQAQAAANRYRTDEPREITA